ncbi:hypothetical protein [Streptomyces sp. NBRC 109706]|uniref:hypothetical protein n=1 Tax=Streptomyces sp. NBRC 109706 TaxID=1550035 RepID=UPI0007846623|nr:hypothetical protein [Streptomyces sp. NBRC 109706]
MDDIGAPHLTWGRLWRLVHVIPQTSRSALAWAKARESGVYPLDVELLAGTFDALATANWQRSKKGSQPGSAPKPVPRPSKVEALRGQARDQLIERGKALLRRQRPRPRPPGH